jgi:molybdopterin-guanine dinucleotide biosynthesis protein B
MKVFGIIGSCEAKASVVADIVAELVRRGYSVSSVKRVRDDVDLDKPGKDTYQQRLGGAREIIIASSFRWALMHERSDGFHEPELAQLAARLEPVDFVVAEGFRSAPIPKVEIVRFESTRRPQYLDDPSIIAIASDGPVRSSLTTFPLKDIKAVTSCLIAHAVPLDRAMQSFEPDLRAMPLVGAGLN